MTETLDMVEFARFAVLPGAADLVKAFAAIPPGPLRDSVIHHAQVIAATYTGAPAQQRMPDPIGVLGGAPRQLATRTGRAPPIESQELDIVQRRMAGQTAADIARALNIHVSTVYAALKEARRGGLPIPSSRGNPLAKGAKKWAVTVDELSPQGVAQITSAAARRGITPQEYLDRRQLALKMALEGSSYDRILKATGEQDSKVVGAWFSVARNAGFNVPYVTFLQVHPPEQTAEPPPEAAPDSDPPEAPDLDVSMKDAG
jgi:DNA-binding CsgD family transcriptional regulator